MPRYHFDLWHDIGWIADESGVELPDDAAARGYGYDIARDIARNRERDTRTFCIAVRGARGNLFMLPFSDLPEVVSHADPATRALLVASYTRQRELRQAVLASQAAVAQSRASIARSRGKPYLVAAGAGRRGA